MKMGNRDEVDAGIEEISSERRTLFTAALTAIVGIAGAVVGGSFSIKATKDAQSAENDRLIRESRQEAYSSYLSSLTQFEQTIRAAGLAATGSKTPPDSWSLMQYGYNTAIQAGALVKMIGSSSALENVSAIETELLQIRRTLDNINAAEGKAAVALLSTLEPQKINLKSRKDIFTTAARVDLGTEPSQRRPWSQFL